MTVRELIDLMDKKEDICIKDLEKPVVDIELYCGSAGELKQDDPIMDMEVIGIVAINDLLCACVRKITKHHWKKYGNKRTCSHCEFTYFAHGELEGDFKYCPNCGAQMEK